MENVIKGADLGDVEEVEPVEVEEEEEPESESERLRLLFGDGEGDSDGDGGEDLGDDDPSPGEPGRGPSATGRWYGGCVTVMLTTLP
jgi:hypothetical protein